MRRLILADVTVLARALQAVTPARRAGLADHIITCACYADRYRRRMRRLHPRWGDGTIEAAARSYDLAPAAGIGDPEFSRCLAVALAAWHRRRGPPGAAGL